MAGLTQQQIVDQFYPGWRIISRTPVGDEFIVDPQNVYSQQMIPNPQRNEEWVLVGPNNARQTITVRPQQVTTGPGGAEGPAETLYEPVNIPNVNPPSGASSQPRKGLQRVTTGGVLEEVIDDQGTWSAVIGADGKVIKAATDPPAAGAPTTKEIGGTTFQWDPKANDGKGGWVDSGLPRKPPATEDRPPTPTVNTTAKQIPEWNGTTWVWKDNPNYRAPGSEQTPGEARTESAEAAIKEAQAATAVPTAEAALRKAQADADLAALNLEDARRKARQAPTDTQAQAAIATAQQAAELANTQLQQQIDQAGQLNPLAVQQAQVTLRRAQNAAKQEQLGTDLASIRERIAEIKSLYQAGEIDETTADMMLGATTRGTTVSEGLTNIGAERTARRTQTAQNLGQLASSFTSMANQAFQTTADMNKYAAVGSSAGADALMAMMNIAQNRLNQYRLPEVPETDFLGTQRTGGGGGISQLLGAAQRQVAAQPAPAPAPAATGTGAQPITINIGSAAASNPQPPTPSAYGASPTAGTTQALGDPYGHTNANVGSMPSDLPNVIRNAAQVVPATVGDIYDAFGLQRSRGTGRVGVM